MKLAGVNFFLVLFFSVAPRLQAQEIESNTQNTMEYMEKDSWEPDDLDINEALHDRPKGLVFPVTFLGLSLIHIYQKKISPNSTMARCPFKTSCSHFAYQSISDKGFLVGSLLFLDRYYYRENPSTPYNYPFYENDRGVLKINDDFYLTSEKY